jgi:hypothetical protein
MRRAGGNARARKIIILAAATASGIIIILDRRDGQFQPQWHQASQAPVPKCVPRYTSDHVATRRKQHFETPTPGI